MSSRDQFQSRQLKIGTIKLKIESTELIFASIEHNFGSIELKFVTIQLKFANVMIKFRRIQLKFKNIEQILLFTNIITFYYIITLRLALHRVDDILQLHFEDLTSRN